MTRSITESTVEQAALDWFAGLGYEVFYGGEIAPGELFAERSLASTCETGRKRVIFGLISPL